ncbi:MAG: hypothetical protein LBG44_11775 [Gemmatimonadota bacterium]|jgi:hypothetical protein|nr:hypothetical protein [Gemmatimonadota bacterium]
MAERNEKIYERVLQELDKNPNLGSRELYAILQGVDRAVSRDSLQQFHARYVLPAKRGRKPAAAATSETPRRKRRRPGGKESPAVELAAPAVAPAAARAPRRARGSKRELSKDRIRGLLLQFAQDLTDAESRSTLVQVLSRVDSYVDRIAAAK